VIPGINFLSALAAGSQRRLRRVALTAALAFAGALSAAVGLGFATYALFYAWKLQYGAVNAAFGLSAIYLVLAVVLFLCLRRVGATPTSATNRPAAESMGASELLRERGEANDAQAAALSAGAEIARQLTPMQLALLAAISGFVAGRKL
jgi:hypothetical protein